MKRSALVATAAAVVVLGAAVVAPASPWSLGAFALAIGAVAAAALLALAIRAPDAPAGVSWRAVARAGQVALVVLVLHAILPRWALVASFLPDATRRDIIATTEILAAALFVLIFTTGESRA